MWRHFLLIQPQVTLLPNELLVIFSKKQLTCFYWIILPKIGSTSLIRNLQHRI